MVDFNEAYVVLFETLSVELRQMVFFCLGFGPAAVERGTKPVR